VLAQAGAHQREIQVPLGKQGLLEAVPLGLLEPASGSFARPGGLETSSWFHDDGDGDADCRACPLVKGKGSLEDNSTWVCVVRRRQTNLVHRVHVKDDDCVRSDCL